MTNADGNGASNMKPINEALQIRHPTTDPLYNQAPTGQVYEPLNEDACAGLAAGLALFGGRSLWLSYESFAINGWPIVQTVGQAMAELRRKTPAVVSMFTAGALEQGRNGWTHQRPEIENYIGGQMRNGNVYLLYPADANMIQAAYGWSVQQSNKCISIVASKSALPVHTTRSRRSRRSVKVPSACMSHLLPAGHGGVCSHRRHDPAAGVRGEGRAGGARVPRAYRQRRQPAASVSPDRRGLAAFGRGRR